ncbi:unnamed protein product [Staurois parvus]|uniref:Secreted protein n=1 Tax=Staurois parvus TaxID=386267 RepID=A0ABN9F7D8_9NEOB|nr:unnamed protein product [Staurois parvus]
MFWINSLKIRSALVLISLTRCGRWGWRRSWLYQQLLLLVIRVLVKVLYWRLCPECVSPEGAVLSHVVLWSSS